MISDQIIGRCRQIIEDQHIGADFRLPLDCSRAVAGSNQQRPGVSRPGRPDVADAVANHRHSLQRAFQPSVDFQQHAGIGLAEGICLIHIRTEKHRVNLPTRILSQSVHFLVDQVQHFQIKKSPTHTGLVSGDHHPIAGMIEPGDGFQTAGQRNPFIRRFDVVIGILIDDAVAVQNDQFHGDWVCCTIFGRSASCETIKPVGFGLGRCST